MSSPLEFITCPLYCELSHISKLMAKLVLLFLNLRYTGIHNNSIMVLVDVKMLSGFTPVLASIQELENNGHVMKTEVKNDHVLFYLENVTGVVKSFTFSVEQSNLVSNIQPAPVVVYNYYEKDEYALDSYNINNIPVSQ
uniref:Alpha-macroglobulin receptor-binding domain-containing protein n=1 Tax=Sciurus vulgaris TaxID=55149 RepID=A0A8D2CS05_SCIVU